MQAVDTRRIRKLNTLEYSSGPIVYWMSREQRIHDNWALLYAQELALKQHTFVIIVFCIRRTFEFASERLLNFMFEGLKEVEIIAAKYKIPFVVLLGDPLQELPSFTRSSHVGALVSDMNPLRWSKSWKRSLSNSLDVPFYEVDAHNIVPVWEASTKQEYAAYTIRPKIHSKLSEFLVEYPHIQTQSGVNIPLQSTDWDTLHSSIHLAYRVLKVHGIQSGSSFGMSTLKSFISSKLTLYEKQKNDPSQFGQSQLSPYLHFGQISSQRVALSIHEIDPNITYSASFLEELIIRKELADNFCWYNESYDSTKAFPTWAKKTLEQHIHDARTYVYTLNELEQANTHDVLWNAAQTELISTGKMNGYLRMYWAKKILEWTKTPADAVTYALFLNDMYSLDGRDPNGYAGIAWSIGGVHDRPWFNRPIYGMIRCMMQTSIAKKYNYSTYVQTYSKHES